MYDLLLQESMWNAMALEEGSVYGDSSGKNTGVDSCSLLQGIFPTQGLTQSPTLQADSLPAEPPRKPNNTGVGSLSLLQWIFPTQE